MKSNDVDRRMAAWLLTLPGPFSDCDLESAGREAQRQFDPSIDANRFKTALATLGYSIAPTWGGGFAIVCED